MKIPVPVNGCHPALDAALHGDEADTAGAWASRHQTQDPRGSGAAPWQVPRPLSHGGRPVAAHRVQSARRAP